MTGQKIFRTAIAVVVGGFALWFAVAYCLPVLLPFLIGLLVAQLAHPLAHRLQRTLRLPRWLATFVCVSAVFAALSAGVWLLVRLLIGQLGALVHELPGIMAALADGLARLQAWLHTLSARAPENLAPALEAWTQSLLQRGSVLGERVSDAIFSLMGGMVTRLPDAILFTVTAVLSSFMLCARLPELRLWLRRKLPVRWRTQLSQARGQLKGVLSGWCKAQFKLLSITFGIVTAGLMLLRLPYALLLGAVIALIDALPVLGAGTVLLPWGVLALLQGNAQRALGLVLTYAAAALTRTMLEPRLLGHQLGLSPLLTLIAIYAGFRLCGVGGMLLFPIGAILLRQVYELFEVAIAKH